MSVVHDVLVIGAGPTGIAVGAAARAAGLDVMLVDKGSVTNSIREFPTEMEFFTTRDRLEIANVPFAIADVKPSRRQALAYYNAVVAHHGIPVALGERVVSVVGSGASGFTLHTTSRAGAQVRRARAVVVATGYWDRPRRLGVVGEDQSWVLSRYLEPWGHVGATVVIVGAGNSACEAALDLWRHGVRVVMVHRGAAVKPTIKFWVKPDIENRIEEGSIVAHFGATVVAFGPDHVRFETAAGVQQEAADAAYVLIGYEYDTSLLRGVGVAIDPETLVPSHDATSGETNVPGLFVAGTLRAGRATDRIFIENSRDHGAGIVARVLESLGRC